MTPEVARRFLAKIRVGDGCWEWNAAVDRDGYGIFDARRSGVRSIRAHRTAFEWLVGPIPAGLQLDHLCRNRRCVRPDHLEPVTPRVNTNRGNRNSHNQHKSHCPSGHPYSGQNLVVNAKGRRECRECRRLKAAEYRAANLEQCRVASRVSQQRRRDRQRVA